MNLSARQYDESEHPRDENGRWTNGGGNAGDGGKVYPQTMDESIAALKADAPRFFEDRTFSDTEIEAVNKYTGFLDAEFEGPAKAAGFEAINTNLRKNPSYKTQTISNLDSAITKSVAPENVVAYRGVGSTLSKQIDEQWTNDRDNVQFKDHAYVSTSVNKTRATKFSKNVMEIRIPKGSNALPISWNGEGEILLPRGQSFKVVSVKKTSAGYRRIVAVMQ